MAYLLNRCARSLLRRKRFVAAVIVLLIFWWSSLGTFWGWRAPARPSWAQRSTTPEQRAEKVKQVFRGAWKGYYENAFPNDELHPVWNSYGNSRNGWGATAVESLSTAIVMEIPEIVDQIMDFIPTIDFHKTNTPVNLFETTIRYLGGMLSAYDLLTGPMKHLAHKPDAVKSLLTQSQGLANLMTFAFDTPSKMPWKNLLIEKQVSDNDPLNTAASVGSLILEWTRLSDLTGQPEFAQLAETAMKPLLDPRPKAVEVFPGIVGTWVNVQKGIFTDAWGSWGAGGDSFYEYLIKMFVYDPSHFEFYKERWITAADSVISTLAETPVGTDLTFISMTTDKELDHEMSHLECFAGGNFILAGATLNDTRYVDFGLTLTKGCHDMYTRTATRIGPEKIKWSRSGMSPRQLKDLKKLGFGITDSRYQLRPETIESYYYAYRVTKDPKYQDWAWDAFVAVFSHTKTRNGFAPISNVNKAGGGLKHTKQESFFFSEFLKYAYLIFIEDADYHFDGNGNNGWIFNTEGHLLRARTS